ncbi:MAG TPA: ribonuclease Y [Clostridiales bacterium]|nr:ribonuclease Y [Clostridiales bacterium]
MIMNSLIIIATFLISLVIGIVIGMIMRKKVAESKIESAEKESKRLIDLAKVEAENLKKEEVLKAKEEIMAGRQELDKEIKERRSEIQKQEARIIQKEENLDKRSDNLEKKEKSLDKEYESLEEQKKDVADLYQKQMDELQRVANLSQDEAKKQLLSEMEKEITTEKAKLIRDLNQKSKEEATKNAKEIISYAVQKCAADHTSETTVSIVSLPSDDIKGRIIGREGRNIKALETLTGIDLIIDDTPEAVILSGFDPLRREVARIALEKLIDDGRIHPAKIEEMVEKAKEELNNIIKDEGERAVLETGVNNLHPDLIKLLGKLKYRTSYGQNVLSHSIEVSNLARIMAEELGLDAKRARRAGLLHDIGKALDHDMEGTHVQIGVDILKKYKENPLVINAVEAHHGDVEPQTMEAVLVQAADAISASRPGARRETLEAYIKRLESLEAIADSFDGVEKSFAIQAGREVRIIVKPEKITDDQMTVLARDVSKRIEDEMEYPGQIKVNVIREKRVVDYAK